jgi:hypothetical protein
MQRIKKRELVKVIIVARPSKGRGSSHDLVNYWYA